MKLSQLTSLDAIAMIENSTELFRLNKYKSKSFTEAFIGLSLARIGFYGTVDLSNSEVKPLNRNKFNFDKPVDVNIQIEGVVRLDKIPNNVGAGGIVYHGYGILEVDNVVIYNGGSVNNWGTITGTLSDQTDLQSELDDKAEVVHTHVETDITDLDKYTQTEVDDALALKINLTQKAIPLGVATLGVDGKVPASQLDISSFAKSGRTYVDETFTGTSEHGNSEKPFTTIKEALDAIPAPTTHMVVQCDGANPVFGGAGTTDIGGKTIFIDAKGKDLIADTETFNNTSINQLMIKCNNFTVDLGGSNIFWKNTNTASNIRVFCSDTYTATSGVLSFYGTPHVITHDATLNTFMNATGGGMAHFKAHDVNSNNHSFGYSSQVFCEIEGTWIATGLAPFQLLTAGSVISGSGEYFSSGNMFANCSGMLIRGTELSSGLSVINGGGSAYITDSVINATTDIANLPLTDCNIKGSTFNVTMSGQSSGEFALNVLGNSVIDDCIVKVLTANYNGIEATSGNVEISDTHVILEDAEGLAWSGNYDLKGNNSKYPNVVTTPATPYSPTATERVFIDCTSGNKVVDLPPASKSLGITYSIKKTDATANTITINGNGGDLIEGSATLVISVVNKTENLVCNGVGWFLI